MSFRVVAALIAACSFAGPANAAPAASASATTPVRVQIHEPQPGTPVRNRVDQAPIRGNAVAQGERPLDIDVMIVIDVSASTEEPSVSHEPSEISLTRSPLRPSCRYSMGRT